MGYTHYWTPRPISADAWQVVTKDFAKLFRAAKAEGIALANAFGEEGTKPHRSCVNIAFNGMGAESHETFYIWASESPWSFTKTNRKPYDAVVCAALVYLAAKHGYTVETDGEAEDWFNGVKLARKAFGGSFLVYVKDGTMRAEWRAVAEA